MSDAQTALARRLLIIDFGYTGEHVTWHEESDTQLWRNTVTKARLLMESPEWESREVVTELPTDDEREALAALAYTVPGHDHIPDARRVLGIHAAQAVVESDVWRNRGWGPITEETVEALASEHYRRSTVYRERMPWEELPLGYRLNRLYEMRNTLRAVGMIQ
ncbi:hypothetical protein SEA_CECE_275 [Microbacterium phage Cece]|nr:hypothetical protein SEA_CECE_275 [Microbacterium phage Cece]